MTHAEFRLYEDLLMDTRKLIIVTVPVIVVVLLVLASLLTLIFATMPSKTAEATTPATEAVQEQMAPPAVLTPDAAPAEGNGKPKVTYENQE